MKIFFCVLGIFILFGSATTLSAQVQSPVTLTWQDNSNNEEGFGIEMLSPGGADFTEIGTVGPNILEYKLTLSGNYGDMFCFRVFAFNATADSPDSNVACQALPDGPSLPPVSAPSTPGGLHSTSVSPKSIGIAWETVPDETQYFLERRLGNTTDMGIILAGDQTSFTDQDVKRNRNYCYRIAAVNNVGTSPFSEYLCIETPPR
jgi:hypothetical protein